MNYLLLLQLLNNVPCGYLKEKEKIQKENILDLAFSETNYEIYFILFF